MRERTWPKAIWAGRRAWSHWELALGATALAARCLVLATEMRSMAGCLGGGEAADGQRVGVGLELRMKSIFGGELPPATRPSPRPPAKRHPASGTQHTAHSTQHTTKRPTANPSKKLFCLAKPNYNTTKKCPM